MDNNISDKSEDKAVLASPQRREFFKRAAIGGGAIVAAGIGGYAVGRSSLEGSKREKEWPILSDDFKPFSQKNMLWTYALSPYLTRLQPERNAQFGALVKNDANYSFLEKAMTLSKGPVDNSKPGFTQLDRALEHASWMPTKNAYDDIGLNAAGFPNMDWFSWDQSDVEHDKYQFKSKVDASSAIRTAAKTFGAARCGIARRDIKWDYNPLTMMTSLFGEEKDVDLTWDDFPFVPKTVIVLAVPMDYDCIAAAPSFCAGAATGHGYTQMATLSAQMAKFIRGLGYHAVASGNDLGNSVAYGVSAGLGEAGRNGALIVPGYGPRVRLCKVYTDFEFVDYDEPRTWGIEEFCKSCKECGHKCPSKAIDMSDDTHFYFNGEHSDKPGYAWTNHEGVKKFHSDAKKCLDYWFESDTDCSICIAACTFNEPDFWHHWMIVAANPFVPDVLHKAMSKMHPAFGYGKIQDPAKVAKFWETGRNMRVNVTNRNNFGAVGRT